MASSNAAAGSGTIADGQASWYPYPAAYASQPGYARTPTVSHAVKPEIRYSTIQDRTDTMERHPVLMENSAAHDPSLRELMAFLKGDDTVKNKYSYPSFTCADFAVEMQHHAESQGIRCGYAGLNFAGKQDGHAIAVFTTTDAGLVYVDTTGGKTIVSRDLRPGSKYLKLGTIAKVTNYW